MSDGGVAEAVLEGEGVGEVVERGVRLPVLLGVLGADSVLEELVLGVPDEVVEEVGVGVMLVEGVGVKVAELRMVVLSALRVEAAVPEEVCV